MRIFVVNSILFFAEILTIDSEKSVSYSNLSSSIKFDFLTQIPWKNVNSLLCCDAADSTHDVAHVTGRVFIRLKWN